MDTHQFPLVGESPQGALQVGLEFPDVEAEHVVLERQTRLISVIRGQGGKQDATMRKLFR